MPKVPAQLKSVKHADGLDDYLDEFFKRSPNTFLSFVKTVLNEALCEAVDPDDERLPKGEKARAKYIDSAGIGHVTFTIFDKDKECDNDTLDKVLSAIKRFEKLPKKKKS